MVLKEVCVENASDVFKLIKHGVKRIELCDNLAEGGTTVSYGVAKHVMALCKETQMKVMAMVRPRKGDFCYNDQEVTIMLDDISMFRKLGVDGVVFGCITKERKLDKVTISRLLDVAEGLEVTFHMAFDELLVSERFDAIDWLAKKGVTRILTHGGHGRQTVEEVLWQWREYIQYAANKIIILPGGGITANNLDYIVKQTGAKEVHGTRVIDW